MPTLNSLTALEAHRLLRRGDISSEDITRDCLRRIGEVEPRLKAFVTVTEELALSQARQVDRARSFSSDAPLAGIPLQVKDVICTEGVLTTCSSRMLEEFVPPYNATVMQSCTATTRSWLARATWTSLLWVRPRSTRHSTQLEIPGIRIGCRGEAAGGARRR